MILLLIILICIYFFPVIFGNQVFYYGDIVSIFWPIKQFFFDQLRQGVFPLWNQYIYSGYPMFADMTLSTFYPPVWIMYFSSSIKVVSWLMILHFFIAGYFTYKLGRLLKLRPLSASFSAVIYTFSGIMVNYIADPQRFFVISLMPFYFWAFFSGRVILIASALALQLFAGHIQYVFIELLGSIIFWRQLKPLLIAGIIAGLITAVSLLPTFEFIPHTTRITAYQDISIYQNFSLHPLSIIRFFLAHFWGVKNEGLSWGIMDNSAIGYIGFLPLIIVFFSIKSLWKNQFSRKLLIVSFASLLISFGTYLPFFGLFIYIIPIFRLFRNPMVFLALYTMFMAIVAGRALEYFRFFKANRCLAALFGFMALFFCGLIIVFNYRPSLPHEIFLEISGLINKNLSDFHSVARDGWIAGFISKNLLIVSLLAGIYFGAKKKNWIIYLTIIDLFIFTRSNLYLIDNHYFIRKNPVAEWLQQHLGSARFLSTSEAVPYSGLNDLFGMLDTEPLIIKEDIGTRFKDQLRLIPPNFGMIYGLPTINGYTSFVMNKYNLLFQNTDKTNAAYRQFSEFNPLITNRRSDLALSKIDLARIDWQDPLLKNLGVKYLVTDRDLGFPEDRLVFRDGLIKIYQNNQPGILPERPGPNRLVINRAPAGKLIIYENYYPGWTAAVNNQPVEISRENEPFMTVAVAEPDSLVELEFKPKIFYWGAWISGLSIMFIIIYETILKKR